MSEINSDYDDLVCPELERKRELQPLIEQVSAAFINEMAKYAIQQALAVPADLSYCELRTDAFDGSRSFYGEWHDASGKLLGNLTVHASGEFFAEYDVLLDHPTDSRWFIEAVTAWGRPGVVKAELRLLPALPV